VNSSLDNRLKRRRKDTRREKILPAIKYYTSPQISVPFVPCHISKSVVATNLVFFPRPLTQLHPVFRPRTLMKPRHVVQRRAMLGSGKYRIRD
jgi:hypothetical protein